MNSAETYATFAKGDWVQATMTAHGMTEGQMYIVHRATYSENPWENRYVLADLDGSLIMKPIRNGHILLKAGH